MRKKESKIIIFLVLFLIFPGFSLIFNFDGLNGINTVNSDIDGRNKIDDKKINPKLSHPSEGRYIHREDPTDATASVPGRLSWTGSLADVLRGAGGGRLHYSFELGEHWYNVSGYSNFLSIDHAAVYQIILNYSLRLGGASATPFIWDEYHNLTVMIHCDNGLTESIILGVNSTDIYENYDYEDYLGSLVFITPIVINETNCNQIYQRVREGGYIEAISFRLTITYFNEWFFPRDNLETSVDYIDIYYRWAVPPSPPANLIVHQRIQHNYLTWDTPSDDGGADITQYNVYRGTVEGGAKSYIGSSVVNNYNDTAVTANTRYYYVIRAENFQGESNNSNEANGVPRDVPFLEWRYPDEDERVILPVGDAIFNFRYDWGVIDDVELVINGINFGSVWDVNSTILTPYNSTIDGSVTAVLNGYIEGEFFVSDSRNFTFGKLTWEVIEVLDEDTEFLGEQLYLILHDPNGDNSYSGFAEQTGLSFGVGSSVSVSTGFSISSSFKLFGFGGGASTKLEMKSTDKHDFRFEITEKTELTSSLDNSDKDYIGPGYGDTYWGEAWAINWQLIGKHRTYFNETTRYEDPTMYYGIIRSGEVLLGDHNAPAEWRALNPVHNDWANVEWGEGPEDNITVDGGKSYSYTKEVTTSNTRTLSFQMNLDTSVSISFPGITLSFNFGLEIQTYMESEATNVYTTSYTIYDDESTDFVSMQRGVDQTFGTPIFRTNPLICKTSNPLEHNTIDYIPPVIEFPNVDFDSSLDGLAPCEDDSPIITVDIFDEGGIPSALLLFSTNDGANWDSITLLEQIANLGTWEGLIPAQDHGTTVLWYIKVWDSGGLYSNRTDPHGNPYRYTVINRAPTIHITTPNGDEIFENTVRIEWTASDLDDDTLTFTISYNLANTGWHLIESNVVGNYYDWDISDLDFCDTTLIKVVVNDGFGGEAMDESDYVFTIGESVPSPSKPSTNWVPILVIGFISLAGAAFTIAILLRRSRRVQE